MGSLQRYGVRVRMRRAALERGLARVLEVCRQRPDVRAVYVFGSVATGLLGPTSDLDLLVVRETALPYHDRGDDLRRAAIADVRVDLVVVTPHEYRHLLPTTGFGKTILDTAKCVYAA